MPPPAARGPAPSGAAAATSSHLPTSLLFAVTISLGAYLLFWIQPLFAKQALPLLGGSPGVWSASLVFFQAALLAGYLYAHWIARGLSARAQVFGHLGLAAVALLVLPVGIPEEWIAGAIAAPDVSGPGPFSAQPAAWTIRLFTAEPALWVLGLFAAAIGLPFFVVAATSPLLQRWFADAGFPSSDDPYFLYSASNLGSLAALLAFPLLLEPRVGLLRQSVLWAWGFGALMALLLACGVALLRRRAAGAGAAPSTPDPAAAAAPGADPAATLGADPAAAPGAADRLWWGALAFAPSSLLLGVTTHITTDVAAVPLLWIVPLALYLASFAIVFARRPLLRHPWMVWAQPFAVIVLVIAILFRLEWTTHVAVHLIGFFLIAMVCHGELARRRPPARHLTEFYLWVAIGGVAGGAFNALAAPRVFDTVLEYPLMIALACALRPVLDGSGRRWSVRDALFPALLLAGILAAGWTAIALTGRPPRLLYVAALAAASVVAFSFRARPVRLALGVGALLVGFPLTFGAERGQVLARERSFFGVHTVRADADGTHRLLYHGTTLHGAQAVDPERRTEPLTYYSRESPIAEALASAMGEVGVVGLGTGSMACHRRPGQRWTFFEIDPVVVRLATETEHFDFLARCAPRARIVLGDARLSLRHVPEETGSEPEGGPEQERAAEPTRFDILVLDAFSSDAIPVHLLTLEAVRLYISRLAEDGVLAFHISNRHLRLAPALAAAAEALGLAGLERLHRPAADAGPHLNSSHWVVLARDEETLRRRLRVGAWNPLEDPRDFRPWTDDWSNILSVLQ